ncbi:MAG: aquaporin [Deltaproteobacteria bacterium]|nr:aquaporin [Deltaproteobacteria bacterium]
MEGALIGVLMISIGGAVTLFEYPRSPAFHLVPSDVARRCLIAAIVGVTVTALVYSPWGQRTGAHMNPAVTLAFLGLAKVSRWDAVFYIVSQFAGGLVGVVLVSAVFGAAFTEAPVAYAKTLPGLGGTSLSFFAELVIAACLMLTILEFANSKRARWTGVAVGALIAAAIALEAPISGMSINPARTFASAAPVMAWDHLWLYFVAPVLGTLLGAQIFNALGRRARCAKLHHAHGVRCIHCQAP